MRALTQAGLRSPAAVAVGVAVTILFGAFALSSLPIQLFPDIDRPQIGIETDWRSETPREVEAQLVEPEEDVLQGIQGLQEMDGYANSGAGYISLTFALGTDMKSTLIDVIGRLNRLPPLPLDAQKPAVQLASTYDSNATLIYLFMQKLPGNSRDINSYEQFLKNVVVPRLSAVPGVGGAIVQGVSANEELQIVFDPMRAAQLGIQIPKVANLISNSDDISGGTIDVGRRQYELSFRGRFSVDDLKGIDSRMARRQARPPGRHRRRAYRARQAAGLRLSGRQSRARHRRIPHSERECAGHRQCGEGGGPEDQ